MVEKSGVEKSGVEKFRLEMFTQNLGLKLGVEKSGVEMSFNRYTNIVKEMVAKSI